jgi:hypothetical protein
MSANICADVKLHLCPPSPEYFFSLGVGEDFILEIIAESDAPGVSLLSFTVTWTPENSVEFVIPRDETNLTVTGFFPPTSLDFRRLTGIAPNWRTANIPVIPGATPEISIFTAPAANYIGPDSLTKITLRKLSSSYPSFSLKDAKAVQYISGSESIWVNVSFDTNFVEAKADQAQISGVMFSQADSVMVNIGGADLQANVVGGSWMLDIKNISPSLNTQPITVKARRGGNLLNSLTVFDFIRSPGWYENPDNHSQHPGDCNGDGVKDVLDLMKLGQAYSSSVGDVRYDFRADYNADGMVNLSDLLIFTYYGRQ